MLLSGLLMTGTIFPIIIMIQPCTWGIRTRSSAFKPSARWNRRSRSAGQQKVEQGEPQCRAAERPLHKSTMGFQQQRRTAEAKSCLLPLWGLTTSDEHYARQQRKWSSYRDLTGDFSNRPVSAHQSFPCLTAEAERTPLCTDLDYFCRLWPTFQVRREGVCLI